MVFLVRWNMDTGNYIPFLPMVNLSLIGQFSAYVVK